VRTLMPVQVCTSVSSWIGAVMRQYVLFSFEIMFIKAMFVINAMLIIKK